MEDHTEHSLYTENEGEIVFEISAVHNVNIIYCFFPSGAFRQMPVLPLPPSSQDFPHPLVYRLLIALPTQLICTWIFICVP